MIRRVVFAALLAASLAGLAASAAYPARAQGLEPGAMAGRSYVPSTHTKGCSGFLCDSDDPRRAAAATVPPPACEGLLCSVTPFGMGRPVTAAEAQRMAGAPREPVAAPLPAEPVKKKRSARRKKAAKTVAARTPDPATAQPQ